MLVRNTQNRRGIHGSGKGERYKREIEEDCQRGTDGRYVKLKDKQRKGEK